MKHDPVNHPSHYTSHPSGIECIEISQHMGFLLGNAFKYVWRAGSKVDEVEDLRKALWYVTRARGMRSGSGSMPTHVRASTSRLFEQAMHMTPRWQAEILARLWWVQTRAHPNQEAKYLGEVMEMLEARIREEARKHAQAAQRMVRLQANGFQPIGEGVASDE